MLTTILALAVACLGLIAALVAVERYIGVGDLDSCDQALFDYLACDRVAAAWAMKRPAKDKDLARKQQAEWQVATLMLPAERHALHKMPGRDPAPGSRPS